MVTARNGIGPVLTLPCRHGHPEVDHPATAVSEDDRETGRRPSSGWSEPWRASCDSLCAVTPVGSYYEWLGATCGGRLEHWAAGSCTTAVG